MPEQAALIENTMKQNQRPAGAQPAAAPFAGAGYAAGAQPVTTQYAGYANAQPQQFPQTGQFGAPQAAQPQQQPQQF